MGNTLVNDQSIVNLLIWISSILASAVLGIVIWVAKVVITKVNSIEKGVLDFLITIKAISVTQLRMEEQIKLLFEKDGKRQMEIQRLDKDVAVVKNTLKINSNE